MFSLTWPSLMTCDVTDVGNGMENKHEFYR